MSKPIVTSMHAIEYLLEDESLLQIVNCGEGPCYKTIKFPKGTKLQIFVSKLPIEENK